VFVTCQLHVLGGGRSPSDPSGAGPSPLSDRTFASVEYFDSRRCVIDAITPHESALLTTLVMISGLVADHGAEIAEVDVRGCDDVRLVLKLPVPNSVMAEPSQ
jgi:hypothetical protein